MVKDKISATAVLVVRYLFLTRCSWQVAILLIALAPMSLRTFPGMLASLFVLDVPQQIYHVSWIALWCAVAVMETLRVTTLNAAYRFDDYRAAVIAFREAWGYEPAVSTDGYRSKQGWICVALGFSTAVAIWYVIADACVSKTAADPAPTWQPYLDAAGAGADVASLGWREAIKGMATTIAILGSVLGIVILWHSGRRWMTRHATRSNVPAAGTAASAGNATLFRRRLAAWSQRVFRVLRFLMGPGYFRRVTPNSDGDDQERLRLAPGHVGLFLYTAAFLMWYCVNYGSATGPQPMPTETSPYPALFFILFSVLLVTYLVSGFAFYLDRYRIPVSLVAILATFLLYGVLGTDHYYELNPAPQRNFASVAPSLSDVLSEWKFPPGRDEKRTLVVVDASGGGIQASAWTAQVLTGLHECYGQSFSRSVGLISAVSGGSVGTMFYLINREDIRDPYVEGQPVLTRESIDRIRDLSRASALAATAWGVAHPDSMRVIFPPMVDRTVDRGWAIERVWRQRMAFDGDALLGDLRVTELRPLIRKNQLPVVVFNATLVETGQRLLISPVAGPASTVGGEDAAVELMKVFSDAHPRVSTAARLSATFPYVTPAARALPSPDVVPGSAAESLSTFHVVDGGYADNEGAVTSVDWINRLLAYYSRDDMILGRPFDHVLLVRIQAFPKQTGFGRGRADSAFAGWRSALLGPLDAMMKVRTASQAERSDLEVNLLTQATVSAITASKERWASEFKLAKARADTRQQQLASLEAFLEPLVEEDKLSEADAVRHLQQFRDLVEMDQTMVDQAADKWKKSSALTVAAARFDFHLDKDVRIPLSWKLTTSEKQNIDDAWEHVVQQEPRHPAFIVIDDYFERMQ
ncbi:MAG: hypothetical protein ACC628_02505 [Pirellulaceae bacterium]